VLDSWNDNLEVGDRVYVWVEYKKTATMYDLVESRGWGKAAAGELTPVCVKKDGKARIAVLDNGVWYWR
jgi:elongation factor P hydroxylase